MSSASKSDEPLVPPNGVTPNWEISLPSASVCQGGQNCHRASPTLAFVNTDDKLDIVVATNNGHILALQDVNGNGQTIFNVDIAAAFGRPANSMRIQSTPAVADIDEDGRVEIVVGVGNTNPFDSTSRGGIIVLEHNGAVKPGWPVSSYGTNQYGLPSTVFSSPALGDLDNDGDLEIVAGGFDKRIYAFHHTGNSMAGFPADSYHLQRFPEWGAFEGILADSVWSSPALADLDGDGYLDIIIGTDEGNYDARWGGNANGWTCPYIDPPGWPGGYCGGALYVVDRHGDLLPGWPQYELEIIQSTPIVTDIDGNGDLDIIVGTGSFYYNNSPSNPTYGFKLLAYNSTGGTVSGWGSGKTLGGVAPASPTIGDITGDGIPEIIMGSMNRKLYAFHLNGSAVSGFPMTPLSHAGLQTPFDVGESFMLADYDGDGDNEIFVNQHQTVTIINGNGVQLTTSNVGNDGKPTYYAEENLWNSVALGDIDNDGELEMVVQNRKLFVWDLPNSSLTADWPQFKGNAPGTSATSTPGELGDFTNGMNVLHQPGSANNPIGSVSIHNDGDGDLNWTVTSKPSQVSIIGPSSGVLGGHGTETIIFTVNPNGFGNGNHFLGNFIINTTNELDENAGTATIPIRLIVANLYQNFLPVASKD